VDNASRPTLYESERTPNGVAVKLHSESDAVVDDSSPNSKLEIITRSPIRAGSRILRPTVNLARAVPLNGETEADCRSSRPDGFLVL
jgi:hypothetical protein